MLTIYDKAQWHIDAGEDASVVVQKMKILFDFLSLKGLLSSEGQEIIELGIDSSASIHERMVTNEGKRFMEDCYDKVINMEPQEMRESLEQKYHDAKLKT